MRIEFKNLSFLDIFNIFMVIVNIVIILIILILLWVLLDIELNQNIGYEVRRLKECCLG